jgi:predicted amidohydrolase YtcJ
MEADIVIFNGAVLTLQDGMVRAEAIALRGREILKLGTDHEVKALAGPATRMIDARGGTVMPGFIEAHMHLFAGAGELDNLDLQGVAGFDALAKAAGAYAAARPGDYLLVGNQADYTIISETEPLTRHHLDRILPDRPLLLFSPDHHTAWANTTALARAGILSGKVVGAGNEVVMEAGGLASGELRESEAISPVMNLSPSGNRDRLGMITGGEPEPYPDAAQFAHDLAVMRRGLDHCAKHGITSIHNMDGNLYTLELLAELDRRCELLCRVCVPFHFKNFMAAGALERASAMAKAYHGEKLKSGFVKFFMDGVLDSWTAVMLDEYADRKGWRGEPLFSAEQFKTLAVEADRRGLQIAVHAIGDGAVRAVLDGYEAAALANGKRDSRHRVEHIEVVHDDDIPRFAALGVLASMQPPHPPGNHGLPLEPTLSRIGKAKWRLAYAWNILRAAGARLVFASDWPVSDINPIRSIQSAMTRRKWSDELPDQRQSLSQALRSYTREGAYAEFAENRKGQLKEGFLADIVILSADLEKTAVEKLHEVRPVTTICDGVITYEAPGG